MDYVNDGGFPWAPGREGGLNLYRANYGVIILLPKIKEVVNIKQYRPICLLNVFYKIFM
jgi:hypothetical protein